jgi:hypothetical protein
MRTVFHWLAIIFLGLTIGIGSAILSIRSASLGNDIRVGPWSTGRDIGTANADIRTRAVVALRGLLALPASEARYFTARTDSAGRPLSGRCSYAVDVRLQDARWWSITVYDPQGWLIPNAERRHSYGEAIDGGNQNSTPLIIRPERRDAPILWGANSWEIISGTDGPVELTLRVYQPGPSYAAPTAAALPRIRRLWCAP